MFFAWDSIRILIRRILHPLLLLSLVAEPHPHHTLLEVQLLGDGRYLVPAGPLLHGEVGFQRPLLQGGDGSPLSFLVPGRQHERRIPLLAFGLEFGSFQPGLQDWPQRQHVVPGQGERLEPAEDSWKIFHFTG